ncbi:hypothetical protein EZV62_011058 [Acer yangbiense]|uniref:HRDC domain-containing protein n=1 Tax=Acer yangbiense TaxID=1000413 RepID=A0A5C7I4Q2_9ROSI|nr:hypothetical protein EZV62_011058 [Acer yangbiense]
MGVKHQLSTKLIGGFLMNTSQINKSAEVMADDIDDDEILKNIDVDQIVMEHYQSTCTPQPSISKLPPITPNADNDKFGRQDDACLTPELCSNCNHGFKLGLCPEATGHIQEMKDKLIAISNELLDNADLSPAQIEKLRQDRLQLNKQIQQLEGYLYDFNIPAAYLNANIEWTEQQEILRELNSDYCKYKLLYVTPEKVAKSDVLLRHLESLNSRELLARIVIDGDMILDQITRLGGLGILKQKFPNTPVLALTATATASVKEDVVQALGLIAGIRFIPKTKKCLDDIDKLKVADKLQWSKDEINIICATVAYCAKGEGFRILRHLVLEDFLTEEVKKSDFYGSVSADGSIKGGCSVNESKAYNLCEGRQNIVIRLGVLISPPVSRFKLKLQISACPELTLVLQQNLSAKLYSSLRILRTILVKEAGEGVMAYHIFGNATLQQMSKRIPRTKEELLEINVIGKAKVSKYGDRLLETIEATIKEYYKTNRNSSGSNDSNDSIMRRRDENRTPNGYTEADDDYTKSTARSKKRIAKIQNQNAEVLHSKEPEVYSECLDDVDFDDYNYNFEINGSAVKGDQNSGGRVLPPWSTSGNR